MGVTTGNMICWHWNLKLPINKNDEAKEEKHLCYELTLNSLPPNTAQISPSAKQGHRLIIIVRTHKYTHLTTLAKSVYVSCVWKKKRFWYPSIYLMIIKYMVSVLKSHIDQASDPV